MKYRVILAVFIILSTLNNYDRFVQNSSCQEKFLTVTKELSHIIDSVLVINENKSVCIVQYVLKNSDSSVVLVSYLLGSLTFIGKRYPFMFENIKAIKTRPFIIVAEQNNLYFVVASCSHVKSDTNSWIELIKEYINKNNSLNFIIMGGCGGPIVWINKPSDEMWIYISPKDSVLVKIY